MSRIHDELRRGQKAAAAPVEPRSARTDTVLAALGSRSNRVPGERPALGAALAAAIVVLVGVLAWTFWPMSARRVTPARRTVAMAAVTPRVTNMSQAAGLPAKSEGPVSIVASPPVRPPVESPEAAPAPRQSRREPPSPRAIATATPTKLSTARQPVTAAAPAPDDLQLALYYQRTGEFDQSLVQYKKVLQRDELNVEAHNNLGTLYQSKGLYEEAAREFQRVVAIDPRYATAHLNLSAAYLRLGRSDAAAAEARDVLAIEPRHSDALVNLALAQEAGGQSADARQSLRRALEIDPHHAAAHYNLAQQYDKAGEVALAVDHYRQFLQYAAADQTAYVTDVRARLQVLTKGNK